jgi:predicted dehydrogenase
MILAGAGLMGKTHLESARNLRSVRYVAVADTDENRAGTLAGEYGLPSFGNPEEAIRKLKPDAVDVCVPTPFHLPLVRTCAAHGVHVLCEKPIALSRTDAHAIRRIAREKRIRVMVAQVLRFWPEYVYTVEAVQRRTFGRILAVDCARLSPPPGWNSWMLRPEMGGGAVIDLQIHDMDFVLQLLGKPSAIQASGRKYRGTFNAIHNQWIYPSGIPVTTEASFIMPETYPFRMYFSIELEKAVLEMDFWRPKGERLKVFPVRGKVQCPVRGDHDAYGVEIEYFANCLRKSAPFKRVPLQESITALDICLASARSCQTHGTVKL